MKGVYFATPALASRERRVSRALSTYLDFLRVVAAFAVLLGHAQGYILPGFSDIVASHAEEGVAIFFVLSGFVIRYVTVHKETRWRDYAFARFSRMYSVVPTALIVTFFLDRAGMVLNPEYYTGIDFFTGLDPGSLLRSLTFTNELWFYDVTFGSNHAYWSLGFEVSYYLLLGLVIFLPGRYRIAGIAGWMLLVGPKILAYLPLWLLGAVLFHIVNRHSPRFATGVLMLGSAIAIYGVTKLAFSDYKLPMTVWPDTAAVLYSMLYYLAVAVAASLSILAAQGMIEGSAFLDRALERARPAIQWVAGGTFTLYLVHQPILVFWRAAFPDVAQNQFAGTMLLLLTTIACYAVAELGERRKRLYRGAFAYLHGRFRLTMRLFGGRAGV